MPIPTSPIQRCESPDTVRFMEMLNLDGPIIESRSEQDLSSLTQLSPSRPNTPDWLHHEEPIAIRPHEIRFIIDSLLRAVDELVYLLNKRN